MMMVRSPAMMLIATFAAFGFSACPENLKKLGESCESSLECEGGLCAGTCLDRDGDFDSDGITNAIEVEVLASNPREADTDGDGIVDNEEWGGNATVPLDSDGDGVGDILESATEDRDGDCLADQVDPIDETKEALVQRTCATAGVCLPVLLKLNCEGTTLQCDYSSVPAYQVVDACNGLDDNCDGTTDEGASCDDANACTDDRCDGASGCANDPNTEACDDGDVCTTGDVCDAGACSAGSANDCDDANPCTDDSCDAVSGCDNSPNTLGCDDGDGCTTGDVCAAGACSPGTANDCDDGNLCTDDSCDAVNGCENSPNTLSCDDGDLCTTGDVCDAGACSVGIANDCDDGNLCTDDSCNAVSGCENSPNTLGCDDGDACTTGDVCAAGACSAGTANDCDDGNPCTDDSCDAVSGCENSPNTLGCDDGDACTTGDVCAAGACSPGTANGCDDGNPCTDDSCDAVNGCDNSPNTLACDDGDTCTFGDVCAAGACIPGVATFCDDGNPCTTDTCDSAGACVSTPAIGAACDDGNACTAAQCGIPEVSTSTCEDLGWENATNFGDPTVCGQSLLPACNNDLDFVAASAVCTDIGARLCSLREIANDEASGTGCGLNSLMVWTASPCEDGASAWVRRGSTGGGTTTECRSLQDTAAVRCCADTTAASTVASCEAVGPACSGGGCGQLSCDPAVGCTVTAVSPATCDDSVACTADSCTSFSGCDNAVAGCDIDGDGVVAPIDLDDFDPYICRDLDADGCDDCAVSGPDQSGGDVANDGPDLDGDGLCDVGDPNIDGDTFLNEVDLCPRVVSLDQTDSEGDGVGDICDNCVDEDNSDQLDINNNGVGWACEEPLPTAEGIGPKPKLHYGHCPVGTIVGGFRVVTGAYHDDLDFDCHTVLGTSLGASVTTVGYTSGGGGEILESFPCPPDQAIVGFRLRTNQLNGAAHGVESHCYPLTTILAGGDNTVAPVGSNSFTFESGDLVYSQAFCPDGQAMTGFAGYTNLSVWVTSLSLFCEVP